MCISHLLVITIHHVRSISFPSTSFGLVDNELTTSLKHVSLSELKKVTMRLSIGEVVKSSTWLYIGALIFNFLGFFFWFIASLFVTPQTVGTASAVLAFESLLISVFSVGANVGLRRFIGQSWGDDDKDRLSLYFSSSIVIVLLLNIPVICLLFIGSVFEVGIVGLGFQEIFYVAILLMLGFWPPVIYSLLNSVLKTRTTAIADIVFSSGKLILAVILLYLGFDLAGILIAFIAGSVLRGVVLSLFAARLFRKNDISFHFRINTPFIKDIIHAGVVSWIPTMLATLGQSFAILIIYGVVGGGETGVFYVALAISLIVYRVSDSIMMLMFPVLSGMDTGKKQAISTAIRLSMAATIPACLVFVSYPSLLPGLLGSAYSDVTYLLLILALGAILYPIVSGYNSYIYAVGKYRHVITIGLVITSIRLFLYIVLVSPFGEFGISIAYDIGIAAGLIPVIISARRQDFSFPWRTYFKVLLIPGLLSGLIILVNLTWVAGIPLLFILSIVSYTRMGVITKADISEIANAFFSPERITKVRERTKPLLVILFGE